MWTAFTTDDRGLRLTVFGTEQGLRYRIPFKPVEDVMSYLAARRTPDGRFVGVMGDDGEKLVPGRAPMPTAGATNGGSSVLRGNRSKRRLAQHGHALDLAPGPPPDRPSLLSHGFLSRNVRVGSSAR